MKKHNLTYTAASDINQVASRKYGVSGIPVNFIINRKGNIIGKTVGYRDWSSNDAKGLISDLLKNKK